MVAIGKQRRRKQWAAEVDRKLHGHRRRTPEPESHHAPLSASKPPAGTKADARAYQRSQTTTAQPATPAEIAAYRRVQATPRELKAERAYQSLMRVCIDEPRLSAGIWMSAPEQPGETWRDREPDRHPSPIALPQETITARQYAAEWALLWGECVSWAMGQMTTPEPEWAMDYQAITEMTEGVSSSIVRWSGSRHKYEPVEVELRGNLPSTVIAKWWREAWDEING
jgi:hypothetical protein